MRIISVPNEIEETCPYCGARLAYVYRDLVERNGKYYMHCPNCGGSFPVTPSEEFIRELEEYLESLHRVRCGRIDRSSI